MKELEQSTKKAETYRVNQHKWPGHPEPYRATPGRPGTSDWINLPPSGHPAQVTGSPGPSDRITRDSPENCPRNRPKL
jgi:hypothetical protein